MHRIAWLIDVEGVSPHGILAVTFTNKAAAELRARTESLLNVSARSMWVGTFHGLAHRLLRMHWSEAKLPQNFQIIDSDDQVRLIKRIMKAQDVDEKNGLRAKPLGLSTAKKMRANVPTRWPLVKTCFRSPTSASIRPMKRFVTWGGLVDFAELLLRSHELWLNDVQLLAHYQERFSHLLVDEFQDTNTIQYAWLRVLAGQTSKVMAVGDDDQSIYGWRGAKIENIHQFTNDFADVATVRLEQNYRSTQTILEAANGLIQRNNNRLGKELWSNGDKGEPLKVYAGFNDLDEARFIAERIQQWVEGGGSPSEAAILYRSNAQSRVLEEALLRLNIPYQIYGGQRFFERAEIKNALAYMRLMEDRHSDPAFERVVNTPTRGIGDKTLEAIRQLARTHQTSMWEAAKDGITGGAFTARVNGAVGAFISLIDQLAEAVAPLRLDELAEHVIDASGLMEFHSQERGERGLARKENLQELVSGLPAV